MRGSARRFPGATEQTARLLNRPTHTSFETVVASLIRDISAIGRDLVIIFDDWHLVDHVAASTGVPVDGGVIELHRNTLLYGAPTPPTM